MAPRRARTDSDLSDIPPFMAYGGPSLLAQTPADPREAMVDRKAQRDWSVLYRHLESRFQALYSWRTSWWTTWGQIARYERPYRFYPFLAPNVYNTGLREDFEIIDRTATLCGEICAAGLMATLTDPDRDWLELGPAIPGMDIDLDSAGKTYYADLTERLNYVYDHCNFYDAQAQVYDDLTFFGNGVPLDYEDAQTILNVMTPCLGEFMLSSAFTNTPESFYREFRQTISACIEQFGPENCPQDMLQMWKQKGGALEYENVIRHAIEPNYPILGDDGAEDVGVVPGGYAWREVYWVQGKKDYRPLSMTGYHEKPHSPVRWKTQSNEAYGRGVGEDMLGDCVQLQLETRQKAISIEKVNEPPMGADVSLMNLPSSTSPGKITYMNTNQGGEKKFWSLYEIKPDIPAITADIGLIQERLARTAYNDVFQRLMTLRQQLHLKADITATEVEQLTEEVMTRLGPMMGRIYGSQRERTQRHLRIMARKGLLPRKPPSLRGVPLRIGFNSVLTEVRRALRTQSVARTMQFAGAQSAVWPELKFAVDAVEGARLFAAGVNAPPKLMRSEMQVQAMIQREKQDQKMQQLMATTLPQAKAAQALSNTSLAPGTALSALVQPPGGGAGAGLS